MAVDSLDHHNHHQRRQMHAGHARMVMEKRQRVPLATEAADDSEQDDDATTTTTVPRLTRAAAPTADTDSTTTVGHVRQPLTTQTSENVDDAATSTSSAAPPRKPLATPSTTTSTEEEEETTTTPARRPAPATTTSSTSTTSSSTSTSSTPTTSSTSSRSTSSLETPTTTSTSSTSASTSATSTSAISSVAGINAADANNTKTSASGGSSNAGTIAGVVIALVVVAAIAAFFGLRWRKKRQRAAEDAAIFPGGAGGIAATGAGATGTGTGAYGAKRSSKGYNQHLNSFEDLSSGAGAGGYGEKQWGGDDGENPPNMAGYGSRLSDYSNNNEKPSSGMAGYGTLSVGGGMNHLANNNASVRGSYSQQSLLGRDSQGNLGALSPGGYVSSPHQQMGGMAAQPGYPPVMPGYPPQPQQQISSSPSAAMMAHQPSAFNSDRLPPHQAHELSAATEETARRLSQQQGDYTALTAAGVAVGAGAAASYGNQDEQDSNGASSSGPFADPASEGKTYVVCRTFEPSMPDELVIFPGDRVQIVMEYDDGWCLGCNLSSPARDGQPIPRGVFPRDCVEEYIPTIAAAGGMNRNMSSSPRIVSTIHEGDETDEYGNENDLDQPLSSASAVSDLSRAPTLPPLEMGNTSRFSMDQQNQRHSLALASSAAGGKRGSLAVPGNTDNRQSLQAHQIPLPASSGASVFSVPASPHVGHGGGETDNDDEEMDDIYGGVAAPSAGPTPTTSTFPPNIQVSRSASTRLPPSPAKHNSPMTNNSRHLSGTGTLDADLLDEFPSTPRTANSPSGSAVETGTVSNRLSTVVGGMPKSGSSKSLKRTSSLIASKDADLFLQYGESLNRNGEERH